VMKAAVGPATAAVMIEPILGEAGVYPVPDQTLVAARDACDRVGALLIFDEIQSGIARTGSLWAYEQTPVRPNVLTTAKALGGGLPIGACLAGPVAAEVLEPGDHGSTFAGGPLVASAALAVLDVVDDPELLRRVRDLGARLRGRLEALDGVCDVRGRGLMLGVALEPQIDAEKLGSELLDRGLVVNVPEAATIRLLPPLTVGGDEVERATDMIAEAILTTDR
jgi:acetylornithine/N-succinyldiaminopimelate aminotransferase